MQERYWKMLSQTKYECYYYEEHFSSAVKTDRWIKLILISFSCGSIVSWATWNKHIWIWAIIIVAAQVFQILNDFFPYKKRINEVRRFFPKLDLIYGAIEKEWLSVSNGDMTDSEINNLIHDFKEKISSMKKEFLLTDSLPSRKRIKEKSEQLKNDYFSNNF